MTLAFRPTKLPKLKPHSLKMMFPIRFGSIRVPNMASAAIYGRVIIPPPPPKLGNMSKNYFSNSNLNR